MAKADAAAIALGISGERLMEAAGKAVADVIIEHGGRRVAVLCGPGNNGGDGFVAARHLRNAGREVRLGLLGDFEQLSGDARLNADRWEGETEVLSTDLLQDADCVVDAIFGAGLSRDVDGAAHELIDAIGDRYCVAVDVPSGIHGDSGEVMGIAPKVHKTVTFFRLKPGHLLYPGRAYCGEVVVVDIGIPDTVLEEIGPSQWRNGPSSWTDEFPWPRWNDHKYSRGHAIVVGGAEMTGAARLAVQSAMRVGAGIVSIAVPTESAVIYRVSLPERSFDRSGIPAHFAKLLKNPEYPHVLSGRAMA